MTDQLDQLRAALADRYAIEREIGSGGMATVYLAEDVKHRRKVAVKVLRPDLAATLGPERFLREIEIAAQLQHPHILPLLDSGSAEVPTPSERPGTHPTALLYYVMPYIEGQSLRDKLSREGELPVGDAVRIIRDVVDALTEAHAHGVVHRDIKPENILLRGRHALVTDFGVAKAVSEATGREQLTTAGVALGTPAYMAPEQAAADPHLDHRVDIYAVGAVAYELLTGRPVFLGTTPQMVLSAHVTEAPQPVTKHRETVPTALDSVVLRCLEKKPADRFQTAEELLSHLEALATPSGGMTPTDTRPVAVQKPRLSRGIVLGGAAVGVLAAAAALFLAFGRTAELNPNRLVVAPFEDQTGVDSLQSVGAVVADYVTNAIARSGLIEAVPTVAARGTLLDHAADSPADLGSRVDAGIVVSGTYFLQRDSIVFQAQITDANESRVLAAVGPVAGPTADLMATVDIVRQRVLGALAPMVDPQYGGETAELVGSFPSFEAYRDFVEAFELFMEDRFGDALERLYRALENDSTFAQALVMAAISEWNNGSIPRADSLIQLTERYRADLAPLDVATLDWLQGWISGDREAALAGSRNACQLAALWCPPAAQDAMSLNLPAEALEHIKRSYSIYGTKQGFLRFWAGLTHAHHVLGEHQKELDEARRGLELNPGDRRALYHELRALIALERVEEVRERISEMVNSPASAGGSSSGYYLYHASRDARAHGLPQLAAELVQRAIEWLEALPPTTFATLQYTYARALYTAERWLDAEVIIDSLAAEQPDNEDYLGYRGVIAARVGDTERAMQVDEQLASVEAPYMFGDQTVWRARIAALLGDQQQAMALLTQALGEGAFQGLGIRHDMDLESLQDYPPFQELIRPKG